MANLKNVIYLSNEDYETLVSTGTVTIDGETLTYDENNVYVTPDKLVTTTEDGLMSCTDKVILDTINSAYIKNASISGNTLTITKQDDTTVTYTPSFTDNDHYPTTFNWTNGTTSGPTGSLTGNSGFSAVSFGAIPSASISQSGIVNTGSQTFAGSKSFSGGVITTNIYSGDYSGITITGNDDGILLDASDVMTAHSAGVEVNAPALAPHSNNATDLGTDSLGWKNFHLVGAVNPNTSGYGLLFPATTSFSASKTVATTSDFSASTTGTATTEAKYVTINGTEWKLPSGGGSGTITDVKVNNTSVVSSGVANIPLADASTAGVVSTGAQTFAGEKTFANVKINSGYLNLYDVGQEYYGTLSVLDDVFSLSTGSGANLLTFNLYDKEITFKGNDDLGHYHSVSWPASNGTLATTNDLPQVIDLRS